jgi:lipopolysaccharide assembly outer membrane protein LptD (OstA)
MKAGLAARAAGSVAFVSFVLAVCVAGARAESPIEVRVDSPRPGTTTITLRAAPDTVVEDRTAGANPAAAKGPASAGETFTGELTLFLGGTTVPRPGAIEVADPLISTVRLFPDPGGTTVAVFVRQPVTYSVTRPSAIGEIVIELHSKSRTLGVTVAPRGKVHVTRPKTTSREVAVDAESLAYERETNTLVARGGVTLTRGDTTVTADEVRYDRTNSVAEARGHVVITDPQSTVEGDFAHLDLDDESGWVEQGRAQLRPSDYSLQAGRIDKLGGPLYHVDNGIFTTCRCGGVEKPSWSIGGVRTDVKLQGSGVVRHAIFRVKDVPVFYFPYLIFPANTDRQSGFLFPRIGNSNRRGFQWEQPFFWAINKSSDATVAVDVETAARVGVIGEYRYMLSKEAHGNFTAAYYNEQIRGKPSGTINPDGTPADPPENRFALSGRHVQPFYGGSRFYLNLFAISDDSFLKEINTFAFSSRRDLTLRSTRYTDSSTGVIKTWENGSAWMESAYYQDLIDPQELALQKLPRIEAQHAIPLLGDRLVGRVDAEAIDYQRQTGYAGLRGDLAPELFMPFRAGRYLNGSLSGQVRETLYHLTDTQQVGLLVPTGGVGNFVHASDLPASVQNQVPDLAENQNRELAEVNGRIGTEFARVFDFHHFGFEKLRHSIEPEMRYLFVPNVGRQIFDVPLPACSGAPGEKPGVTCNASFFSEGYLFDDRDAINHRNFFSYGVTTRLVARGPTTEEAAIEVPTPVEPSAAPAVERTPVDVEQLAQGLPAAAIPDFIGPPAPPPPRRPGAPAAPVVPASRELARFAILHGYDPSRPLVGNSHASDVDLGIRLTPIDYLGLSYNATVSFEQSELRGQTVGLFLREPWWTATSLVRNYQTATTVGISYRSISKNANQEAQTKPVEAPLFATPGLQEVDGSVYLRVGNYVGFTFLARYDLQSTPATTTTAEVGPHFFERDYGIRLISRCNCWILEAGVADKSNPDERLFRVQFTLVGLGSFGKSPLTRNYVGFGGLSDIGFRRPGITNTGF